MIKQREIKQDELKYVYDSAMERMECHPEIAEKYRKRVKELPVYTDREKAVEKAARSKCQVWAEIGENKGRYFIKDRYIISDDNRILQAAEYIGMEQVY